MHSLLGVSYKLSELKRGITEVYFDYASFVVLRIVKMLTELLPDEFDIVYDILKKSFPISERRPYHEQKALLSNPLYRIYVCKSETGEIMAFFAVWSFDGFAFIEHFAVNENYRGEGIGAKVLQELISTLDCPICLEVEPPDNEISQRRIGFYTRNGFRLNEYDYMQPPISKGRKKIPLMIMSYPEKISEEVFKHYKKVLYAEVYKYNFNFAEE